VSFLSRIEAAGTAIDDFKVAAIAIQALLVTKFSARGR
jgi:hypothetical protein